MPLPPSQPPPNLPDTLRWKRVKVKAGIKHPMLLAGEPFGTITHHPHSRTLPCYAALAGCSLRCPWCTYQRRFTVWVPLINFEDKHKPRIVVQGGRRTWQTIEAFKPGDMVQIARGESERDTITFHGGDERLVDKDRVRLWRTKLPMDIRPYLFHLWQLRDLTKNFGLDFVSSARTEEISRAARTEEEDPARNPEL